MRHPWLILIGGLVAALLAYGGSFFMGSAPKRCLMNSKTPELAWLKKEFQLPDAELERISRLHEAYLAGCAERCLRIDAKNDEAKRLLAQANAVTLEVEKALQEAALLRAGCQKAMLEHFYEVSRTMPPEQGRRYLAWIIARTLGPSHATMTPASGAAAHEHPHE
jgi:hypothetical protein